jgi:hypothetical protein
MRNDVAVSALAVARELARALAPDIPPGTLAASLALVLGAANPDEADSQLDAVGIPRLDPAIHGPATGAVIEGFGGEQGIPPGQIEPSAGAPVTGPAAAGSNGSSLDGGGVAIDAAASISVPANAVAHDQVMRGRLRSYVVLGPAADPTGGEGAEREITEIDRAGVARVIEHERASGRHPKEMEHHNPGYDVESRGVDGNVLRFIEVKSLEADWVSYGVSLTPRQVEEARRRRELFWLYVVERAQEDDFRIYKIQDPWPKVDQYLFDDGWKSIAVGGAESAASALITLQQDQ